MLKVFLLNGMFKMKYEAFHTKNDSVFRSLCKFLIDRLAFQNEL